MEFKEAGPWWHDYEDYLESCKVPIIKRLNEDGRFFGSGPGSFIDSTIVELEVSRAPCSLVMIGRDFDRLHVFGFEQLIHTTFPSPTNLLRWDVSMFFVTKLDHEDWFEIGAKFKGVEGKMGLVASGFEYREVLFSRSLTRQEYLGSRDWLYPAVSDRFAHHLPGLFDLKGADG